MGRRDPLFKAMKRSEYAFKRSEFDPSKARKQKWPWYDVRVGESFFVPDADAETNRVRAMAYQRSNKSGYEYTVSKQVNGTLVTRIA